MHFNLVTAVTGLLLTTQALAAPVNAERNRAVPDVQKREGETFWGYHYIGSETDKRDDEGVWDIQYKEKRDGEGVWDEPHYKRDGEGVWDEPHYKNKRDDEGVWDIQYKEKRDDEGVWDIQYKEKRDGEGVWDEPHY